MNILPLLRVRSNSTSCSGPRSGFVFPPNFRALALTFNHTSINYELKTLASNPKILTGHLLGSYYTLLLAI